MTDITKKDGVGNLAAKFAPDRRRLMALGLGAGALAWSDRARLDRIARAATPPAKPTGQVIIGLSQEPTVFHPLKLHIEVDEGVYFNLFSPLWRVDPKGKFVPDLAAEMPTVANGGISEDGLNWRIKLRDDVKWHDGTPFTAEDVKFTLDLHQQPEIPPPDAAPATSWCKRHQGRRARPRSPGEWSSPMRPIRRSCPGPSSCRSTSSRRRPIRTPRRSTTPGRHRRRSNGASACRATTSRSLPIADYLRRGPLLERLVFKYIPDLTVLYTQFQTGDDRLYRHPGHHAGPL